MQHLADSNLLVALAVGQHEHHESCLLWFDRLAQGETLTVIQPVRLSFLRLLTQSVAPGYHPLSNQKAWAAWEQMRRDPRILWQDQIPTPDRIWLEFSSRNTPSPKLWMDAYLAAIARAERLELVTLDQAFTQFAGLDYLVLPEK